MKLFLLLASLLAVSHQQSQIPQCDIDINGCVTCQEELVYCYECSDHSVRKDDFTCLSCPANCHECKDSNKDDVTECTDCEDYFYKTSSETCDWCQGHCQGCDSDALGCDTCEERYYKTSGAISCDECTTGCERCEDSSTNGCFECYDGYFHTETGSDIGTGTCTQCGANCLRCNNAQSCEECVTGTTWTGSSCTNCITYCDSDFCTVNGGCEQCIEGYSLVMDDPANHYCLLCQNCAECPTTGGCTECEPRYILDEVYHTCDPCPALDTNAADCVVCGTEEQGRFLNSAGFCDYCIPNCDDCDGNGDTGGCDSNGCIVGYYFDSTDNSCGSCDSSCDTCDGPLSTDCTGCEDGERLDSGTGSCEVCNDATNFVGNCKECSSTSCTECVDDYYLYIGIEFGSDASANTRGECRSCPDLESEFEEYSTFQAICEDCSPDANRGRLWNTDPCLDCPTNCTSCDDNGVCEECMYHDHNYITTSGTCAFVDETTFPGNCTILVQDGSGIGCRQCDPDHWYNGQDCNLASDYQSLLNTTSCFKFDVTDTDPDDNGGIRCLECAPGYYWDPDDTPSGNCINAMISDCVELDTFDGTNTPACIECSGDTYLDAGLCSAVTSAVTNCAAYSSATVCRECKDGFFLDTVKNYCVTCDSGDYDLLEEACRECNGDGGDKGTYWVGSCQDCIENCVLCSSTTTCVTCADGYYYDTDNKVCAALNCGSISHANACELCSDEQVDSDDRAKFWSTSTCIDCPENCVDCSSETTCTTCAETYVWDNSRKKCVTCNFDTETECENCWYSSSRGRWYDSTSSPPSCNICPSLCTACSSATVCTECVSSAFMSGDTCKACSGFSSFTEEECGMCTGLAWTTTDAGSSCQECGSNCVTCLTNGGGKCDVDGCDGGYYYDTTNEVCTLCISNCDTCSTGTTCDSNGCYSTFYRNDASTCTTCPSFCSTCVDSDGCTACQTGYYLDDSGNCQSCSVLSNCAACSSATTCTTCNDGFYKLANDAGGVECTACIDGCAVCSAADSCDTCESQRCYDITGPACRSDPSQDCETCLLNDDDTLTCLTCPTGFNLQVCKGCISNCLVCSDSTTCDTCAGGFYKNTENTCTACPGPNCLECNDGTDCDDCGDTARWNTNSGACQDCPGTNCIDCGLSANDDWECKTCASDAFYTETADTQKLCNPCLTGCSKCSESTKDTCDNGECAENYYQNVDNICTSCPSGCAECVEDAETLEVTCIACQDAYYMKTDGTCETCSTSFSNCAKCYDDDASDSIDQYECLKCGDGYYMVDYEYECARCDLDNCAICLDPLSTCIDCGSSGTLGEDARQCGVECYLCDESYDGAICDQAPTFNVTRTGGCGPGYCITWVNVTDGVSTYGRGCPPDLSNIGVDCGTSATPTNEQCFEIDADNKFCWSCCTDDLCNTNIVDGTAGAEAVFHFLQVSLLTAFLALVVRVL